jgi:phosphatidylserine/phosphatidylglycerophosphate/cardiolipin synthase-like enzyme
MIPALLLALLAGAQAPQVELVESWPSGTTLDHADIRDAADVWLEMIDGARATIDLAEFYASDRPKSRLEKVVESLERAARRGVKVRGLFDAKFQRTYPDTIARLAKCPGIETHLLDLAPVTGGVLHAKYFLVDGHAAYLGSQNLDWRSLEHIQELGVRVESPDVARALGEAFDLDWTIAGGGARPPGPTQTGARFPLRVGEGDAAFAITPVYSPQELAPDPRLWDLPRLVALIDGAKRSVRVQLLTYRTVGRDGRYFADLEDALRRAAARGVAVQLLVADWSKRKGTIEGLQSLEPLPNVEVRLVTIPEAAEGHVPFARVVHAKYLVVDGASAWVGTSNWERDYFYASRNVGLLIEGGPLPARLDAFFLDGWNGKYAYPVDPCAQYTPPKTD